PVRWPNAGITCFVLEGDRECVRAWLAERVGGAYAVAGCAGLGSGSVGWFASGRRLAWGPVGSAADLAAITIDAFDLHDASHDRSRGTAAGRELPPCDYRSPRPEVEEDREPSGLAYLVLVALWVAGRATACLVRSTLRVGRQDG